MPAAGEMWDGSLVTLAVNDSATMSETTNGSMVVACVNCTTLNNAGTVTLTSGASVPVTIPVAALTLQPTIVVKNWRANNLNLTNSSLSMDTPIAVEAYGPGIAGQSPAPIVTGAPLGLRPMETAQGMSPDGWMRLTFQYSSFELAVFAFIGGPPDAAGDNAYVIAVNSPSGNTGPGMAPAPAGYFATSSGNRYSYSADWSGATLYVAYFGSATVAPRSESATSTQPVTVTMLAL